MGLAQGSIGIRCMVFVLLPSQYIFILEKGEARQTKKKRQKVTGQADGL